MVEKSFWKEGLTAPIRCAPFRGSLHCGQEVSFTDRHAFLLGRMLSHIDDLEEDIERFFSGSRPRRSLSSDPLS